MENPPNAAIAWNGGKHAGGVRRSKSNTHWRATIVSGPRGSTVTHSRSFFDSVYGTKERAFIEADNWRRQTSDALGMTKNKWRYISNDAIEVVVDRSIMVTDSSLLSLVEGSIWYTDSKGYVRSSSKRRDVKFHRVVTGFREVDHINRDKLDNRRVNLREATSAENSLNKDMRKDNVSGVNGVSRLSHRPDPVWTAQWREGGSLKSRSFAVKKYGEERAKRMAIEAREEADARIGCRNGKEIPKSLFVKK